MSTSPARSVGPNGPKSHDWLARLLYALVASVCARPASVSAMCTVPGTTTVPNPGGLEKVKPVTELPGESPRSPLMTVAPVFVTVVAPSTAKLAALPNRGAEPDASGLTDPLRAAALIDRPTSERRITRVIEIARNLCLRIVYCLLIITTNKKRGSAGEYSGVDVTPPTGRMV